MLSTSSRCGRALALLAALVALIVLTGCASGQARSGVEEAVRSYNVQLVKAFAAHDMNLLSTVATRDQAYTEYFQMAALGESGVTLESTLTALSFSSIEFSGDASATARTTEVWDFRHISNETSQTVRSAIGVTYHLRYDLVLSDGRWLVDRVTSLDASGAAPQGGK